MGDPNSYDDIDYGGDAGGGGGNYDAYDAGTGAGGYTLFTGDAGAASGIHGAEDDDDILFGDGGAGEFDALRQAMKAAAPPPATVDEAEPDAARSPTPGQPALPPPRRVSSDWPTARFEIEAGVPLEGTDAVSDDIAVVRRHPLFANLFWNDYYKLATRAMERVHVPAGVELQREGSTAVGGTHFFVVTRGTLRVVREGEEVATLGVGDGVGDELCEFLQPASSSIVCVTPVEAMALDAETFLALVATQRQARIRRARGR